MMSKILDKKESLVQFIREQTIGPGINGYRFIDLEDEILLENDLYSAKPIDYASEILDIVPAAIYSTGILFPEDDSDTGTSGIALDNNETIEDSPEEKDRDSQNNSNDDIDSPDTIELNQMFPRTTGFTCCLDEKSLVDNIIEISVNARHYKKIKNDKEGKFNNRYGLLCEADVAVTQKFIDQYQLNPFRLRSIGLNTFIILIKLSPEEITDLKARVRAIQKQIAELLYDKVRILVSFDKLTKASCYLSNLKSTIYYDLKNNIIDDDIRTQLYSISQEIEQAENIADHLRNLLDINSGGYGLWQSELVERIIRIENIEFAKPLKKRSYLYKPKNYNEKITILHPDGFETNSLDNIYSFRLDDKKEDYCALSVNIQLNRDSRKSDNKIFLKVQLVNTSTAFVKDPEDNRYYSTFNELVNQKSFFGVKLSLTNRHLVSYNSYSYSAREGKYDEDTTTRFIYDQFRDFGIGHGCSVKWDELKKTVETEYIPTCETPDVDPIPRNKYSPEAVFDDLSKDYKDPLFLSDTRPQEFKWLSIFSEASNSDILNGLNEFVDSYGNWIKKKQEEYDKNEFRDIASQELTKCRGDYERMKHNIKSILSGQGNKDNLECFRLMNAAMFMQLWHSVKVKKDLVSNCMDEANFSNFDHEFYKHSAEDKLFSDTESASWRAFQLAFILLNLDGIFQAVDDSAWDKRNNWVDLVWFPTGGGKTEAYLGLIALTILNRRKIHSDSGGGTAAIMRYTLRLLTMQQFQRATLVIMALELIRRWNNHNLGEEPIYIGFWVGNNSIPNKLTHNFNDTKKDSLQYEYEKLIGGKDNKIPFTSCPWCNSKLRPHTSKVDNEADVFNHNRLHLYCDNNKCSFTEPDFFEGDSSKGPIPVNLCDESIYQHPPSLLFGTVDKFAQLAHKISGNKNGRNSDSRRIFGQGNWENGKPKDGYLPPDLIIQDELHLLLGPLGSAVALFESAVNQLCTRKDGTRPKIISSTATTRNTQLQIAALFDRDVDLFPKPGVECDDSFFAFYSRRYDNSEKEGVKYLSKRKYIGVLPTGRTQIWMQMRLAAIIMTHRAIFELKELGNNSPIDFNSYEAFGKAMDYYHTTISYFNSLKEVGKTQSQIQTYILKELRRVFSRVIRPKKLMHSLYTYGPIQESELTGRLSGEEVKNALKRVETKWSAKNRFSQSVDNGIIKKGSIPPEFVVATNMISVGIDVSRFNTIIMNSMPRNTAEYIQASSRVGRESYGLVLTVHHPFRARDISHYEKFIEFHEKMYSYVEPISITPFTQKAVERYMGLYLATMIRHKTRFVERDSASEISTISETELNQIIYDLTQYFDERKKRLSQFDRLISNLLKDENITQIKKWVQKAFQEWKDESNKTWSEEKKFVFNHKKSGSNPPQEQLYVDIEEYEGNIHSKKWQVPMSLRVIDPESAIKINPQ